jgi:opacity protein-like surface antigen
MLKQVVVLGVLASVFTVHAGVSPYLSLSGGLSMPESERFSYAISSGVGTGSIIYDTGYNVAAAAGVAFDSMPLRLEFEVGNQKSDVDYVKPAGTETVTQGNDDRSAWTYMVNTYVDIKVFESFTPFLEFGIGSVDPEDVKMLYAVQVGFGVAYSITENYLLDLKYTYLVSDQYDFSVGTDAYRTERLNTHQIQLGLRYQF